MSNRSLNPQAQRSVTTFIMIIVVVVLAWWVSQQLLRDSYRTLIAAAIAFQVAWVVVSWRASIYVFMVYVVVEGFILNYFHTMAELNLLKDLFVCSLFAILAVRLTIEHRPIVPRSLTILFLIPFAVVYVAQVFNPHLPNILVGVVGVRVVLLFILLIPVGFHFFESTKDVVRFFVFLEMISLPVAAFGIFQYFAGPAWMISLSPGFSRAIFYAVATNVRVDEFYFRTFSTFVQTGSFSTYLWFMMVVSVALFNFPSLRLHRTWIVAAFCFQFVALLTTGGRTAFVLFFVTLIIVVLLRRRILRLVPAFTIAVLLFLGAIAIGGPALEGRFATLLDFDTVRARQFSLGQGWLAGAMASDPVGLGAGYATIASRHAGQTDLNSNPVENTLARIRYETGLVGFVLYLFFIGVFTWDCLRLSQATSQTELRWLSVCCSAFMVTNFLALPFATPFDTSPTNVFLWFLFGFLLRVPYLEAAPSTRLDLGSVPARMRAGLAQHLAGTP